MVDRILILQLFLFNFMVILSNAKECIRSDYGHGSFVCVCNATYCDTVEPYQPIEPGKFIIYSSNREGLRFTKSQDVFQMDNVTGDDVIKINPDVKYQVIQGWGGTFTDSTGYNLKSVNTNIRENILRAYFSKDGIEYNLCRVPIGGNDVSIRYYSYDEVPNDVTLSRFNLTLEDYQYKIPVIKEALSLTNNTLKLIGSTWNAPSWMKTNNAPAGVGILKREYYQTWVDYHIKFLDEYRKQQIDFWGITTGNEPLLGFLPFNDINNLGWLPWEQGNWIADYFGPTIRKSKYSSLKIIAFDDNRFSLPVWLLAEFLNNKGMDYIDGIGVHWYLDNIFPAILLEWTHFFYPNKFLLGTEACTGYGMLGNKRFKRNAVLGNWHRAELYADDIMEDLEHWFTGWIEWNLALNLKGGPSYIGNYVDASIIINSTAQEFYKQPTFYILGHFSKFIPPKSVRIGVDLKKKTIKLLAFLRPDNGTALVVYNKHNKDVQITIHDPRRGHIKLVVKQRSINTILYW